MAPFSIRTLNAAVLASMETQRLDYTIARGKGLDQLRLVASVKCLEGRWAGRSLHQRVEDSIGVEDGLGLV